jgi:ribokinase
LGQNRILVVKGANDALKPADVDSAADLLKSADCIVLQFEIPIETVYYTVQFARRNKVRCLLNPAPAQPIDMKAIADLDYFVPNESEAETISGSPVRTVDDAKKCAHKFLEGGIRRVILTLGVNGALFASQEAMEHVPAFKVKTVDSTGAGDAFIGSFATFLGEGLPELEAVRRANLLPVYRPPAPARKNRSMTARVSLRSGRSAMVVREPPSYHSRLDDSHLQKLNANDICTWRGLPMVLLVTPSPKGAL